MRRVAFEEAIQSQARDSEGAFLGAHAVVKQRSDARWFLIYSVSLHAWLSKELCTAARDDRSPALHNHFRCCRRNGADIL